MCLFAYFVVLHSPCHKDYGSLSGGGLTRLKLVYHQTCADNPLPSPIHSPYRNAPQNGPQFMKSCERHLGKFTNSWVGLQDCGCGNSFFWGTLTSSNSYPQIIQQKRKQRSCVTFSQAARLNSRACVTIYLYNNFMLNLVGFHFSFFRGCSLNTQQMMKIWDPCQLTWRKS